MRSSNPLLTDAEASELCHVEEQRRPADIDQFAALTRLIDELMDPLGTIQSRASTAPTEGTRATCSAAATGSERR
jgi:hypothetical protein